MSTRDWMLGCLMGCVLSLCLYAADAVESPFQRAFNVDKTALAMN